MSTVAEQTLVHLTRTSSSLREVKAIREAAKILGATEIILRARGQWLDERSEDVDLQSLAVPIRDVKSIWIEANIGGKWLKIRPNSDPTLAVAVSPFIEIEITFPSD